MTKSNRRATRTTTPESDPELRRLQRSATRQERELPDAPLPEGEHDSSDLLGESEFSADEAGERLSYGQGRTPGGPPDRDPFTTSAGSEMGRRALEDATEAPAQERFEPQPDHEVEMDLEAAAGPDEDFAEDELGEIESEEEPDERELRRQERDQSEQGKRAAKL